MHESGQPNFIFNYLQTQESIEFFLKTLADLEFSPPKQESHLYMAMLWKIAEKDQEIMHELIGFCAESIIFLMYKEEPIIRLQEFLTSEIYSCYLESNEELREVVFEYLIIEDEHWVRFCHVPLFIFCYTFVQSNECTDNEIETIFQDLWRDSFNKYKHTRKLNSEIETNVLYLDFGVYFFRRYDWEGCALRLYEELVPFQFNKIYVEPKLKSYLEKIGTGDDNSKILNHISLCKYQVTYDQFGVSDMWGSELSEEISMIEHLSIAEGYDISPIDISKDTLLKFKENKELCVNDDGKWRILIYKIEDIEHLKELGIYESVLKFIKDVEDFHAQLLNRNWLVQ